MNVSHTLRRQLTWSHFAVTVLSVVILELLLFVGYLAYLRSDWVAWWAGETALFYADDLTWWLAHQPLDAATALDYLHESGLSGTGEDYSPDDLVAILDANGRLLASNTAQTTFPYFDPALTEPSTFNYFLDGEETHIGQAPIINEQGNLLGWVYYQAEFVLGGPFSSEETARGLLVGLLVATVIAVIVFLVVGNLLARSLSRRLEHLSKTAVQLANGRLQERVALAGNDEIAQLGNQFNQMAAQLEKQMQQLRELVDKNKLLAEEASSLAALEERNRLARELHDAVKQQVFGLSLLAGSIRPLVATNSDKATERLLLLEQQAQDVHVEMDSIIRELRPASLADKGLGAALQTWVDGWAARTDMRVKLTINHAYELPLAVEQMLYRVAQEALHNVAKHAQATAVQVRLHDDLDSVLLQIIDNGIGFDTTQPPPARAFGLHSMAERVASLNGRFAIRSEKGAGTIVEAEVGVPKRLKISEGI